MKTHIKICGFTEPIGLQAAVAAGVDSVGLVLDPSPRQLSIADAVRLRAHIPETVQLVAVCGRPDLDTLQEIHRELQPDLIQLMSDALPDSEHGLPLLPAFEDAADLEQRVRSYCAGRQEDRPLVLTDGPKPGSGILADWSRLHGLGAFTRLMIAGGLRPSNVGDAIQQLRPWGVDVSSGVESGPGVKSPELVSAFIDAVRTAESSEESRHD